MSTPSTGTKSRSNSLYDPSRSDPGSGVGDIEAEYDRMYPTRDDPRAYLSKRTPEQVFDEFDTDGSGELDMDEFMAMLPALGIMVSEPKAVKMFRQIDTDGSGAIDLDEFKVAMYAIDPVTGNTLGFEPNQLLTPKDAFEMFDKDGSGSIDEDEFAWVLEYLGIQVDEERLEKLFNKYDADGSGEIEYLEFRKVWLHLANVKSELIKRGVTDFPKWAPKRKLIAMLEEVIEEEERNERKALLLAEQWKAWRGEMRAKLQVLEMARLRSEDELGFAMDAGGQVYIFGKGAYNQFSAPCRRDGFRGWTKIKSLWDSRLHPAEEAKRRAEEALHARAKALGNAGGFADTKAMKGGTVVATGTTPPPVPHNHKTKDGGKPRMQAYNRAESMRRRLVATHEQNATQKHVALVDSERALYREDIRGNEAYTDPAVQMIMLSARSRSTRRGSFSSSVSSASSRPFLRGNAAGGRPRGDISSDSAPPSDGSESDSSSGSGSASSGSTAGASAITASTVSRAPSRRPPPAEVKAEDSVVAGSIATVESIPTFGTEIERTPNELASLVVSDSTLSLWGKRVVKVVLTGTLAFALTDTGRVFAWGGHDNMWTSVLPAKEGQPPVAKELNTADGLTARSKLLIGAHQAGRVPPEGEKKALYEWGGNQNAFLQTFDGVPAPPRPNLLDSDSSDTSSDSDDSADKDAGLATARRRKALRHYQRVRRATAKAAAAKHITHAPPKAIKGSLAPPALPLVVATASPEPVKPPPHQSKFRRFSAIMSSAVHKLAKKVGISTPRQKEAEVTALITTPRLLEEALVEEERDRAVTLRLVLTYYGVWEPPPVAREAHLFYERVLLPKVTLKELQESLKLRCKDVTDRNKVELTELLAEDLALEAKVLGKDRQKEIKNTEEIIAEHLRLKQFKLARQLQDAIKTLWRPLMAKQELVKAEKERILKEAKEAKERKFEEEYVMGRLRHRAALQDTRLIKTARNRNIRVGVTGFTPRGPEPQAFRGGMALRDIQAGESHCVALHSNHQVLTWGSGAFGRLGLGGGPSGKEQGRGDRAAPTLVPSLAQMAVVHVTAGHSHSAAITSTRQLYVWGSGVSGKLGLGTITEEFECFAPVPALVRFPTLVEVSYVSCGGSHTAAVSTTGELWMWGCSSNGRLGLPDVAGKDVVEPRRVEFFAENGIRVAQVACGTAHTLALSRTYDAYEGRGELKACVPKGGQVFMAGARSIVGVDCPVFTLSIELAERPCQMVSAGFGHSAAITVEGELWTWGSNRGGCCAQPIVMDILRQPTLVQALFVARYNLCTLPGAILSQSTTYADNGPDKAIDGKRNGYGVDACTHTLREWCPYWEVDLGTQNTLNEINVWNREDSPLDPSYRSDYYTSRLFPVHILVSQTPFPRLAGKEGLQASMVVAKEKKRFYKNTRQLQFTLPFGTVGRYVRVQCEGYAYMHVAQVEVFGAPGTRPRVGRVTHVECGNQVTAVTMAAVSDPSNVELQYRKAVKADAESAMILRQLETYHSLYDEIGRGENILACPLCRYGQLCEICYLEARWPMDIEPGPFGRRRRLKSITDVYGSQRPPPLDLSEFEAEEQRVKDRAAIREAKRRPKVVKAAGHVMAFLRRARGGSNLAAVPEDDGLSAGSGSDWGELPPAAFGGTDTGPIGVGDLLTGASSLQDAQDDAQAARATRAGRKKPKLGLSYTGEAKLAEVSEPDSALSSARSSVGPGGGLLTKGIHTARSSVASSRRGSRQTGDGTRRSSRRSAGGSGGGTRRSSRRDIRALGDMGSVLGGGNQSVASGAGASAAGGSPTASVPALSPVTRRMPKKRIGGKIRNAYKPPEVKASPKPFTDADVDRLVADNPVRKTQAAMTSVKSPTAPKKRGGKIRDGMTYK